MCGNDLSNRISVDETGEEYERNEMIVEDLGIEVEICWDQSPCNEERDEAKEGPAGSVSSFAAGFDDVERSVKLVVDKGCGRWYARLNCI